MTTLLQEAIRAVAALPEAAQDHFAVMILAEVNADADMWERRFGTSQDALAKLADEAVEEHERGNTRPLDPEEL
jgi:hypothetical protein